MNKKSSQVVYRRILLKLSGEALMADNSASISADKLARVSEEVASVVELGVEVAIVIGGGNILRGADLSTTGLDRVTSDQMGMLATVINGLALRDAFNQRSIPVGVMSAIGVPGLVNIYDRAAAICHLKQGKVMIFVGGTGNPLVTTDTAAALRGVEIGADLLIKATKVDGVFAADPIKNPKAERYDNMNYDEVLEQRLGVMDLNAILLCKDNGLPLRVFNMNQQGALQGIVRGENVGTFIRSGE